MEARVDSTVIALVKGDITQEATDAIVNAANSALAGGGGVDGAIHRAGGPEIMKDCRRIGGCIEGHAVITTGGRLKAAHVIHTVGPVYRDGAHGEGKTLKSAYQSSLRLAIENGLTSISFPSISTGAYGYPVKDASEVALRAVIEFIRANPGLKTVRFVLFSASDLDTYEKTLERLVS